MIPMVRTSQLDQSLNLERDGVSTKPVMERVDPIKKREHEPLPLIEELSR